jgi:hypothetical protein
MGQRDFKLINNWLNNIPSVSYIQRPDSIFFN